ncbi:hypothetical protein EDD17DRAFT_1120206 [Pisolithus thermaeus]|nr:hypothetical protein EDD17DRAFT_1120206 [Pisolithus thermaeus]
MRYTPLRGSQQSNAKQSDARHEAVLRPLRRRCQALRARFGLPRRNAARKQMSCELKSIPRTLGIGLLECIWPTFRNVYFEPRSGRENSIDYDRHLDTPSVVQQIEALQVKLDTTEDEDEQRALEEDVTGKILWLCWCGICAEVDELLPKAMDYLRREENREGLSFMSAIMTVEHMMLARKSPMDPGDDQAHLRRIMHDAGAHISKHELLLAARAADQARWAGANVGTLVIDNEGTAPSTSYQTPQYQ